ncbi:hypothetical protein H5T58_00640 [Candidatus Parcubacteria bacterium]|nr:hypothetical protein [Candidatus Parcubacteria bacterium]
MKRKPEMEAELHGDKIIIIKGPRSTLWYKLNHISSQRVTFLVTVLPCPGFFEGKPNSNVIVLPPEIKKKLADLDFKKPWQGWLHQFPAIGECSTFVFEKE